MGKNIAILLLLGAIGFFGYYALQEGTFSKDGKPQASLSVVKQKVPVVIYSGSSCRYCVIAKDFLDKKNVQYEVRDINVGKNAQEMMARTNGQRSIPQIFINHKHIGGLSELTTLDQQGKLNDMLLGVVAE